MTAELPRITAVLLAAGTSRRMGGDNKLLLPVEGEPMIRRVARTLLASRLTSVTLVTGHDAAAIETAVAGLGLRLVHNPHHGEGQMTSVRAGVLAAEAADGHLIALGDQPALEPLDVDHLIAAFAAAPPDRILVPMSGGARGNPIILPASARAEVAAGAVDFGCRHLIERHPERVHLVEARTAAVLADVDTPESYRQLSRTPAP